MADIRIKDLATTATTSASDDYLALDGSTNGTRKILATNVANNVTDVVFGASGPSAKSSIAARAARQGLVFDGTAKIPFSLAAFGTNPATIHFWFNPATFTANPRLLGASSAIQLLLDGTGVQFFTSGGSVYSAALTVGKMAAVTVVINGNGTALIYTNGIAGTSGSITANLSTAIDTIGGLSTGNVFSGVLSPLIYNRALSAAEVVSLYEAGVPAGADYNNASNTSSIISGNDSDFSGAGTWTTFNTATASVTGGKLVVSGVASGTSGVRRVPPSASIYIGRRYRLSFTISGSNGTFVVGYLGAGNTVTNISTVSGNGTFTHEFTADRSWTNFGDIVFINGGGTATAFEVDNVTMFPLGLLLAPDAAQSGGGLAWYDTSGNAANITLPATGVTWNVPASGYLTSSSSLNLRAGGTNQNITLTPSGTGVVSASSVNFDISSSLFCSEVYSTATWASGRGGSIGLGGFTDSSNTVATFAGIAGVKESAVSGQTGGMLTFHSRASGAAMNERARILSTGRFLLGTSTDSGALLQVGTNTTTSAGGMVFGTDTFLYREAAGTLTVFGSANAFVHTEGTAASSQGFLIKQAGAFVAGMRVAASTSLLLTSGNNTTALTLSSTQNATFAGNAVVGGGSPAGVSTLTVNYSSATKEPIGIANSNTGGKSWYVGDGTGTSAGQFGFRNATDSITALIITGTGAGYFAGTISPQSATTASAPAYVKGAMYFDTTLNKLRIGGASAWETVTSV